MSNVCPSRQPSLSARRAWIEITRYISSQRSRSVALRKESVDRNHNFCIFLSLRLVALRKESVDRNLFAGGVVGIIGRSLSARRAWIEIPTQAIVLSLMLGSLSARRAWIEISGWGFMIESNASLSARRAWIEIFILQRLNS